MTITKARAMLALWRRRLTYRARRHRFYHHKSRRPAAERKRLAEKWHRLEAEARRKVEHYARELARARARTRTPRERCVLRARSYHRRANEQPPGSNRSPLIDGWVRDVGSYLGAPWCGIFAGAMLKAVGVKGVTSRIAAVSYIEDDARAGRAPFRGWTSDPRNAQRGDLVVLFGRGVHVEIVDRVSGGVVYTIGGNTSSGAAGSQSNGGGVFRRARPFSAVRGIALVNYPG